MVRTGQPFIEVSVPRQPVLVPEEPSSLMSRGTETLITLQSVFEKNSVSRHFNTKKAVDDTVHRNRAFRKARNKMVSAHTSTVRYRKKTFHVSV